VIPDVTVLIDNILSIGTFQLKRQNALEKDLSINNEEDKVKKSA
jgi:hypothetical protein